MASMKIQGYYPWIVDAAIADNWEVRVTVKRSVITVNGPNLRLVIHNCEDIVHRFNKGHNRMPGWKFKMLAGNSISLEHI